MKINPYFFSCFLLAQVSLISDRSFVTAQEVEFLNTHFDPDENWVSVILTDHPMNTFSYQNYTTLSIQHA